MHVLDPRAALLANAEVLALLRELDADHVARTRSAVRTKKEEDASENLRTVELEAIQYLAAEYHPSSRQSDHRIARLVRDLAPFSLTKAEKLQVVNLAPTEPVELYVIVEELEDRLGDRMHDILGIVSNSLSPTPTTSSQHPSSSIITQSTDEHDPARAWEHDVEDAEFDDPGDGVQGDLDVEEDDYGRAGRQDEIV